MPWGAVVGAGISVIGGAIASHGANSRADRAAREQGRIAQQQVDLANRQQGFGEGIYNDWHNTFFPLGQQLVDEAGREIVPDYAGIGADNAAAFESQRGAERRQMQRYGISPMDGASGERDLRIGNAQAGSLVQARNSARRAAGQQRFGNMLSAYGVGSGMPGTAISAMSGAGGNLANAGSIYGQQAGMYAQQGQQAAAGVGQAVGSIPWGNFFRGSGNGGGGVAPTYGAGWGQGSYMPDYTGGGWQAPMSYPSSRRLKTGFAGVGGREALDSVMDTPIKSYRYKSGGPRIVGTIAEDAPAEISDGRMVSMVNQVGLLTRAVQHLGQRFGVGGGRRLATA